MNEYMEEFKEMIFKFHDTQPKHGVLFRMKTEQLTELITFVKKVCEKAQMYDDSCR